MTVQELLRRAGICGKLEREDIFLYRGVPRVLKSKYTLFMALATCFYKP